MAISSHRGWGDSGRECRCGTRPDAACGEVSRRGLRGLAWLGVATWTLGLGAGAADETVTFSRDVAPIIQRECTPCHREGEAAPFELETYAQVRRHGRQMVEVVERRLMPPWPPESGDVAFVGERRLTLEERRLLRRWVEQGMSEGDPKDLPQAPAWTPGWQLGPPDWVVEMPETYTLAAEGPDQYRNFVIPAQLKVRRYVRAMEFRPQTRAIHHVFVKVDATGRSRRLAAKETEPGFPGMHSDTARMPEGQFLTWQPGKVASVAPPGMPWVLDPGMDLVLQAHLQSTGRPERIRPRIGFYFTNQPPARTPFKLAVMSFAIDIPPGVTNHVIHDSFELPVEVEVLGVLPHGHFLGRVFEGYAVLPGGKREPLLRIGDWDFNWQGDYRYRTPPRLPKGSVLHLDFAYDNSTNNARNPSHPPRRVEYGAASTDEMCELWFQVLPAEADRPALAAAYEAYKGRKLIEKAEDRARRHPDDVKARIELGRARMVQERSTEAVAEFRRALALNPSSDDAHYFVGLMARMLGQTDEAEREFRRVLELNPHHGDALGNLAVILAERGDPARAEVLLRQALEINPDDAVARGVLDQLDQLRTLRPKR